MNYVDKVGKKFFKKALFLLASAGAIVVALVRTTPPVTGGTDVVDVNALPDIAYADVPGCGGSDGVGDGGGSGDGSCDGGGG